jgi:hypothetical protein
MSTKEKETISLDAQSALAMAYFHLTRPDFMMRFPHLRDEARKMIEQAMAAAGRVIILRDDKGNTVEIDDLKVTA